MAEYVARARSNFFRVKDLPTFKGWCAKRNLEPITTHTDTSLVGFIISNNSIPSIRYNVQQKNYTEADFIQELAIHLMPGHVAIVQEIGFKKMYYFKGLAIAVNADGLTITISLDDIYKKAQQLGPLVTQCTY